MLCGKACELDDPGLWMRRIGDGCRGICVKPRETSTWPPLFGTVRFCRNTCVADMEWTLEFGNASGCFDNWVSGSASRALKSLRLIR